MPIPLHTQRKNGSARPSTVLGHAPLFSDPKDIENRMTGRLGDDIVRTGRRTKSVWSAPGSIGFCLRLAGHFWKEVTFCCLQYFEAATPSPTRSFSCAVAMPAVITEPTSARSRQVSSS